MDARVRELDDRADALGLSGQDIDGLFAASDALAGQLRLRSTLSDPTVASEVREQVARKLLSGRIPQPATELVAAAAGLAKSSRGLVEAVERQAVRATFVTSGERMDDVQDEVFRFARTVDADSQLQTTLTDPLIEVPARQQLVADLLGDKALPQTVRLVQRAIAGRGRTLVKTLDEYVEIAAQATRHTVARVTVAAPLTAAQLAQVKAQLVRIYGVGIDVQTDVDPQVLGGVRIEVGDDLIDGTIQNRVNEARRLIG